MINFLERRILLDSNGPLESFFAIIDGNQSNLSQSIEISLNVPQLSSNPTASAKIYLDFDGDLQTYWSSFTVPKTNPYDTDGDINNFTNTEISNINEIWERVSEKFSPFNIDVTTIDPLSYLNNQAIHVVIGGNGSWIGFYGGVSYVGSFYNASPNNVYVFEDNLANGNTKYTAEAICHESGHAFGLGHQSLYNTDGVKINEYNPGNNNVAPVMGNSYYSNRGLWANGATASSSTITQDNLLVLSGLNNGFGYRIDDHINDDQLKTLDSLIDDKGIIETNNDSDVFFFYTNSGIININTSVAKYGAMLNLKIELLDLDKNVISISDSSSLGESLSINVNAGKYYLKISGHGDYGDVGQYYINGNINKIDIPDKITSLKTNLVEYSKIGLEWEDVNFENKYIIQRSYNNINWDTIGERFENSTKFIDYSVKPDTLYYYRVISYGICGTSDPSNTISIRSLPLFVPNPVSSISVNKFNNFIKISWLWSGDINNIDGFILQRSVDGKNWITVSKISKYVRSYNDSVLSGSYCYRILAFNSIGQSKYLLSPFIRI